MNVYHRLTSRYALALCLVGCLGLAAYLSIQGVIRAQATSAAVVNIGGRQRMLSQRIALFGVRLADTPPGPARQALRQTMREMIDMMQTAHAGLIKGSTPLGLPGHPSSHVAAMYFDAPLNLDRQVRDYLAHAAALAAASDAALTPDHADLAYLLDAGPNGLLGALDAMVDQYQREAQTEVAELERIEQGVLALTLLTLVLEALYVFRPMVRRIARETQQLIDGQQHLKAVLDTMGEAIMTVDAAGIIQQANQATHPLWGRQPAGLINQPLAGLVVAADRHALPSGAAPVLQQHFEVTGQRDDSTQLPLEMRVSLTEVNHVPLWIVAARDITDRRRAADMLRENAEQLYTLHAITSQPQVDFGTKMRSLLAMGCVRFGLQIGLLSRIKASQFTVEHVIAPDLTVFAGHTFDLAGTYCNETIKAQGPVAFEHAACSNWAAHACYAAFNLEAYLGTPVYVCGALYGTLHFSDPAPHPSPFTPNDQEFLRLMAQWIGTELEQQQAAAAAQESEERFRRLSEAGFEGIAISDAGTALDANGAFAAMFGYEPSEIVGKNALQFVAPESYARVRDMRAAGSEEIYEAIMVRKDGTTFPAELRGRSMPYHGRTLRVTAVHDIAERRKSEREVQQVNAQLEARVADLQQHTAELRLLTEMSNILQACVTADEAYAVVTAILPELFPNQVGQLAVLKASANLAEVVAAWGAPQAEMVFGPDDCWAVRRGRMHLVDDTHVGLPCSHVNRSAPVSLCIPLAARGTTLGVFHISQCEPGVLSEAQQRLAQTVGSQLELVLSNLQLQEKLRNQSIRDPLTGLFNRRYMEESLDRELRRVGRSSGPLGVMMIDIDHFKQFNDTWGHTAGDTLLREFGNFLKGHVRGEDIACRYGGEEFTIIMPDAPPEVVLRRAETLCAGIKQLEVQHLRQSLGPITCSIGLANFPSDGANVDAVVRAADDALYQAKRTGRDRVVVADDVVVMVG